MKKIFILLALIFLVTGCSVTEQQDLEKLVDDVLASNGNFTNKNFSGYEYYLPRGVILANKLGYNSTLRYKSNQIYLYVDAISYYHKVEKKYQKKENIYFSKILNYDDKKGYINITKGNNEDIYYIDIEYNFGKIETYSNKADLNGTVINSFLVLKNLRFNDEVLNSLIGENKIEYKEEKFDLFGSNSSDDGYLDIIDDKYEDQYNDENILDDDDKIIIEKEDELIN